MPAAPAQPPIRYRIVISVAISLATGALCWVILRHLNEGAGDFSWAIRAARYWLARENPYNTPLEQYPLTAVIFGLPFIRMPAELAGAIFYGLSSGLLAFGVSKSGYHRLLVFLAYPYWVGLMYAQWAPLIFASAFFPLLLPAVMVKPQVGLPVALTHLTRRGVLACVVVFLITLVMLPAWPLAWWHQLGYYQRFIPLLVLPGPLLLLAAFRWRDRDSWLLLLAALMPQRWFFDTFPLWLIPKSRRAIVWTAFFSWVPGIWRWYHMPKSYTQVGRWTVLFIYLPMLVTILLKARNPGDAASSSEEGP
ncbi:MAG TPA: hypothetical protein VGF06_06585 [Terriglobales bacterium]|jgi:hypothetical protein